MLWHIGNTTVRTPYRLRDALRILQDSPFNGNIKGREQENNFAVRLHNEGVVASPRVEKNSGASDLGRKWRAALSQLGFITPAFSRDLESGGVDKRLLTFTEDIQELSGRPFEITPNGYRLARSEIITAQQECFLRSLAIYRIPSVLENHYKCESFSPLRFILRLFHYLSVKGLDDTISFQEFALYVQTATPENGLKNLVQRLVQYREERESAKGHVRKYDRMRYEEVAAAVNRAEQTLDDYADLSIRYLKATGLVRRAGRGIALVPARRQLAELLLGEEDEDLSENDYLHKLWFGAELPTDRADSAHSVVVDLVSSLQERGEVVEAPPLDMSFPDLQILRHDLENKILRLDEKEYAQRQAEYVKEIACIMEHILSGGKKKSQDCEKNTIPKGEAPVYLEWIIWRAFLAIDSLRNAPWEARRFQIDQDFLPVSCAPGGGPDMVFEFQHAIVVVEVTLTSSSRQEAAEGEPVRRHIAKYAEEAEGKGGKPVYGLFIALNVDSNTAHTFRSGDWFLQNDKKVTLDIVPLTLRDFCGFFISGEGRMGEMPSLLKQLLIECRAKANQDAPHWKLSISNIVQNITNRK